MRLAASKLLKGSGIHSTLQAEPVLQNLDESKALAAIAILRVSAQLLIARAHKWRGVWRSPVAHTPGGRGVAGSNPATPTTCYIRTVFVAAQLPHECL